MSVFNTSNVEPLSEYCLILLQAFPPRCITTHLLYQLPTHTAALITTLFSLMTSALAYT